MNDGTDDYLVDEYESTTDVVMTTGILTNSAVAANDQTAYKEDVTYTLEFQPQHSIVRFGKIVVTLPDGMIFSDVDAAENGCSLNVTIGTPTCDVEGTTITFSNAFNTEAYPSQII